MIIIHINQTGIDRVFVKADSDIEEDASVALWPVIRPGLRKINKQIQKFARKETKDNGRSN